MELTVLNESFNQDNILDTFESLIWTDRFSKNGEFEIYAKASEESFANLKEDYYLIIRESDRVMIIEDKQLKFDIETGDHYIITGRSLETILERRIIWNQTILSGNLQNGIEQLLNENVISPTDPNRVIPNFIFEVSDDPIITALTIDAQYLGNNLYTVIENLCLTNNIGFKITLSETNQMIFKLYSGSDRSYNQFINPYVEFSPKYENIISSDYSYSKRKFKNVTLVMGEEVDIGLVRKMVTIGEASSISRREIYTDASNISQTTDEEYLTDEEYIAQLTQKGNETLINNVIEESFDGQVEAAHMFKYGEDFFMGDIVQVVGEYGVSGRAKVTEMIYSQNTSEFSMYPKFDMIKEGG